MCHSHCDTGHNGHLLGPMTLIHIAELLEIGAVTTCFDDLGLSLLGFEHPCLSLRGVRSNRLEQCRGTYKKVYGVFFVYIDNCQPGGTRVSYVHVLYTKTQLVSLCVFPATGHAIGR